MSLPVPADQTHLTHPKYRADIDGLRAIAVLSVVGFHAFPYWIKGGFVGVDIFFVISGFLISSIIFSSLEKGTFSFTEFYARRIKRIFPALILVMAACFAFGWFALLPDEFKQLDRHIVAGAGFVSNLIFWKEAGYFDTAAQTKPLLHLWSLGIEEQFYIFWPLLLYLAWKRRFNFLSLAIAIVVISFTFSVRKSYGDITQAFYSPASRFWELLIGGILAYVTLHKISLLDKARQRIDAVLSKVIFTRTPALDGSFLRNTKSLLGALLICVAVILITRDKTFPGWWALLPTLGAYLIISAGQHAWLNRTVLSHRIMVWFGLISYPLYLWHWPLLSFARIVEGETPARGIRIAAVLISIVLAWLTFRLIEKPIRFGKHSQAKTITLFVLMVVVGYVGYSCFKRDGLTFRFRNIENQLIQLNWDESKNASFECKEKYPSDQYCNITNINDPPDAAIIGDSHANQFYWGLSEYYKTIGRNLINLGAGGCPPFLEVDRGRHPFHGNLNCYSRTKPMYDYVLNSKSVKTVFLSFDHSEYFRNDVEFIDKLNQIHGDDNYLNSLDALLRTIKIFESAGKNVVLIYDMPDLNMDIKEYIKKCFYKWPLKFNNNSCDFSKLTFVNDFNKYESMISEIRKSTSIKIFHTHQYLAGNFPVDKNGNFTYRDITHLSINGSLFFSDKYSF